MTDNGGLPIKLVLEFSDRVILGDDRINKKGDANLFLSD